MDSALYPAEYYLGGGGSNYVNYSDDPGWTATALVLRSFLSKGASILEVGCATGWFVHHANQHGFEAFGCDVSEWAVSNPAPGAEGFLEHRSVLDLQEGVSFDAVVSWEMLEHVPEEHVEASLMKMVGSTTNDGFMVHRIALDDATHDHNAHDDETHFTIKSRDWWMEQFDKIPGLQHRPDLEKRLDTAFKGRDWAGRFFVFRVA